MCWIKFWCLAWRVSSGERPSGCAFELTRLRSSASIAPPRPELVQSGHLGLDLRDACVQARLSHKRHPSRLEATTALDLNAVKARNEVGWRNQPCRWASFRLASRWRPRAAAAARSRPRIRRPRPAAPPPSLSRESSLPSRQPARAGIRGHQPRVQVQHRAGSGRRLALQAPRKRRR